MLEFHTHTNSDGEVLILRRIPKTRITDGRGKAAPFQWPQGVGSVVECPDWNEKPQCGGGLHGWPWGYGLGDGCDYDIIGDVWLVVGCKPEDVVGQLEGGSKCKFRRGTIRLEGQFGDAMAHTAPGFAECVRLRSSGAASATGYSGAASATGYRGAASATGYRGAASATGYRGAASATGDRGAASATGYRGAASATGDRGAALATGDSGAASATGDSGAASATGYRGAASATGEEGCAISLGIGGKAAAALGCWITLAEWTLRDDRYHRIDVQTRIVDGTEIKPDTWYALRGGKFVEEQGQ